jgi:mRNA-degrading endonuclease RelE of RelBE toxin-antitoxin system
MTFAELADERRVRLEQLGGGDAANLDIKALRGRSPWLRMRVGDWRVIYRPADPGPGWYVARVVNRRDLDATVKQL